MGNQMTDEDRFLFDLQGYIVVPDALSAEELLALNEILDEQIKAKASDERTHRFGGLLNW
ncbi:mitomycin antibiotics/polyketide fumonisin biosynthesis protein, partial [Candidatus Poribacteria bacterium]|nr:mitomycin antibiotics/polyketide fumonisin biosynthesis protein [Candidatus Poribacteria bacterium]